MDKIINPKKFFALIFLSVFVLLNLFSISHAKPLPGTTYPYKANNCSWDGGNDQIGSLANDGSYLCIPSGSQKPSNQTGTAGTCGASEAFKLTGLESRAQGIVYWCIPTAESAEKGGIQQITCPTGSEIQKDINGNSIGCFDPSKKESDCAPNNIIRDPKTNQILGCKTAPTSIKFLESLGKDLGKITQTVSGYQLAIDIPCSTIAGGQCPKITGPATYIARLYQFGLMIAGLAAFGSIVYGALKYILSAGSLASTEEAKDQITQAIYGLILLLGAFLILYTINPRLISLADPEAPIININEIIQQGQENQLGGSNQLNIGGGSGDSLCSVGRYPGLSLTVGGKERIDQSFKCDQCVIGASKGQDGKCKCDESREYVPSVGFCAAICRKDEFRNNNGVCTPSSCPSGTKFSAEANDCISNSSTGTINTPSESRLPQ